MSDYSSDDVSEEDQLDQDAFLNSLRQIKPAGVAAAESLDPQELFYRAGFEAGVASSRDQVLSRSVHWRSMIGSAVLAATLTFPIALWFGLRQSRESAMVDNIAEKVMTESSDSDINRANRSKTPVFPVQRSENKNRDQPNDQTEKENTWRSRLMLSQSRSPTLRAVIGGTSEFALTDHSFGFAQLQMHRPAPVDAISNQMPMGTLTPRHFDNVTAAALETSR